MIDDFLSGEFMNGTNTPRKFVKTSKMMLGSGCTARPLNVKNIIEIVLNNRIINIEEISEI